MNDSPIQKQYDLLRASMNDIMESLVSSEALIFDNEQASDPLSTHQCKVIDMTVIIEIAFNIL